MTPVHQLSGFETSLAALALRQGPTMALLDIHAKFGEVVIAKTPKSFLGKTRNLVLVGRLAMARAILQKPSVFINRPLYPARGPNDCAHRRLRNGILAMNGDVHGHFRRLVAPSLDLEAIGRLEGRMRGIANAEVANWPSGDKIDLTYLVNRLSRRMALELVFGEENLERGLEVARAIERHVALTGSLAAALIPINSPLAAYGRMLRQAQITEGLLIDWVRDRRRRAPGDDMMSTIVNARDPSGAALSDAAAAAHLWTIYGASFDTTAATLSWLLVLLAQHPQQARTLLTAFQASSQPESSPPAAATNAIREAMRLCTTAPFQARQVAQDATLPGSDLALRKGDQIVISACVINRSAASFTQSAEFRPGRWAQDPAAQTALLTFGSGPRACPGSRFANAALHAALRAIWARWRVTLEHNERLDYRTSITLSPKPFSVGLWPQDGAFSVARVRGPALKLTPALKGSDGPTPVLDRTRRRTVEPAPAAIANR